ncbi:MAG: glycosyltransferase [archaeon]|jgi:glycosyltransferase involved in cell wall biosynthesis|nr:glycosyltransferase [archaeon]
MKKQKQITIVIPLDPAKEIDPYKELNIKKEQAEVIIIKGKNPSKNRNIGIKKAKTPIVAFINAHSVLSDNWVEEILSFFSEHKEIDIVGGPQHNYSGDPFFARASGYAMGSIFGAGGVAKRYELKRLNLNADETSITSANLACRREVFKRVVFDETIYPGEDPKFIADAKKAGFRVASSPKIINFNKRRANLSGLARQVFNYGRTRPRKESFFDTLKHPFFLVPSAFIAYLLLLLPLYLIHSLFLAPLALYLILNILFSLLLGVKNKNLLSIFILPLIFTTIHISYGLGFIVGMFGKKG